MATAMPGSAVYPRDHYSSWICVVGYLKICDSLFLCFKKQLFVCFLYLLLGTAQTPNWIIIVIVHSLTSESEHLSKFLFCCLCEMTSIHESWSRLALICITISIVVLTVCGQNPAILQKRGSFFAPLGLWFTTGRNLVLVTHDSYVRTNSQDVSILYTVSVDVKQHWTQTSCLSELRSFVKEEMDDLGSPSLTVHTVSVNIWQHWTQPSPLQSFVKEEMYDLGSPLLVSRMSA